MAASPAIIWIVAVDTVQAQFYRMTEGDDAHIEPVSGNWQIFRESTRPTLEPLIPGMFIAAPANDDAPIPAARDSAASKKPAAKTPVPEQEWQAFAKRIVGYLESARQDGEFDSLIISAPPSMLGPIEQALSTSLRKRVKLTVEKELTHLSPGDIYQQVMVVEPA